MLIYFYILIIKTEEYLPSGIPLNELSEFMDNWAEPLINKAAPGASIIIMKDGIPVFQKGYGYSNIKEKLNTTINHIFEWGSITKTITFAAVMQLVEEGLIDLNEDIKTYLGKDFFKKLKFNKPITMYNLMHHNAGWEEMLTGLATLKDDLPSLYDTITQNEPHQIFEPGKIHAYSNYGVGVAGYIVEKLKNISFYKYVKINILDKLGMNETTMDPSLNDNEYVKKHRYNVQPYFFNQNKFEIYPFYYPKIILYPAGSCIGPATDLAKFVSALTPRIGYQCPLFKNNSTLLKYLNISNKPFPIVGGNSHGLWENIYSNDLSSREHGGTTFGFTAFISLLPSNGWSMISLTNTASHSSFTLSLRLKLFGIPTYNHTKIDNTQLLNGLYQTTRRVYKGFLVIFSQIGYISTLISKSSNSLIFSNNYFIEIAKNTYSISNNNSNTFSSIIYFEKDQNNNVKKIYTGMIDYEKVSSLTNLYFFITHSILSIIFLWSIMSIFIQIISLTNLCCKCSSSLDGIFSLNSILSQILNILTFLQYLSLIILLISFTGFSYSTDFTNKLFLLNLYKIISIILLILILIIFIFDLIKNNKKDHISFELLDNNTFEDPKPNNSKINFKNLFIIFSWLSSIIFIIIGEIWTIYD